MAATGEGSGGFEEGRALRWLLVNSVLVFTVSFLATTLVHEGAHAVTGLLLGAHPVLHHNYVSTPEAFHDRAAIPASGPLISLVQGFVFLLLSRRRTEKSMGTLTCLWLGLHGYITFFGYVMLGPLVPYGDTGRVFALWHLPGWLQWTLALGSLALMCLIVRGTAGDFERHGIPLGHETRRSRALLANRLIAFPVFAGVVLTSLLALPVPTPISLIYPLTSPFVVFLAYGRMRRSTDELPPGAAYPAGLSVPLAVAFAILIVVSRILVVGISL